MFRKDMYEKRWDKKLDTILATDADATSCHHSHNFRSSQIKGFKATLLSAFRTGLNVTTQQRDVTSQIT